VESLKRGILFNVEIRAKSILTDDDQGIKSMSSDGIWKSTKRFWEASERWSLPPRQWIEAVILRREDVETLRPEGPEMDE